MGYLRKVVYIFMYSYLFSNGIIIPLPEPTYPEKVLLEMKEHYVNIKVENKICKIEIEESFYNPYKFRIEGNYIFPLPEYVFPTEFSLFINGKEIKGEILEKEKARRIYEQIVRKMKDPALLEYYNRNLFKIKVFPIESGKEVKIKLSYEYELKRKGEFYEIFYPFKISSFIKGPIKKGSIIFDIKEKNSIKTCFSPSHEIDLFKEKNNVKGGFEINNYIPDKDFLVYYFTSSRDFDISILNYKKEKEDGFFLMTISTPLKPTKGKIIPKDIVFVIDVSGSMKGEKIKQAKEGLSFFVDHLNKKDRFNIIAFSSDIISFRNTLVPVTDQNIKEAKNFIKSLKAVGGTNINDALLNALSFFGEERLSYILFLTDGIPTVGERNIKNIIKNIMYKRKRERIFVFGVGYDVNTFLLNKIAKETGGYAEYVKPDEDLEIVMSSLYSKIMYPALKDVEIEFRGINVYKLHPSEIRELFYGQDIFIAGRYKGYGKGQIIIKGKTNGENITIEENFNFFGNNEEYSFIPVIWAKKRISFLLSEIRIHGENKEIIDEIVYLGEKYGIVTPYTSYLVTEEERKTLPEFMTKRKVMGIHKGVEAFKLEERLSEMAKDVPVKETKLKSIIRIKDKVFYLKENIYIDREFKENMKLVEIEFGSDKYFEILKKYPEFAEYFSISKNIIVVLRGTAYKIKGEK